MTLYTLAAQTFDPLGFVEIAATPETTTGEARRRVSRIATLDGGVVVNDAGFSDGDRTIDVAWESAPSIDAAVARMLALYDRATLSTPAGVFTVALEAYTPGGAVSSLRALVIAKQSV